MYSEKNNSVGAAAAAFCIGKPIIIKDNIVIVENILNKNLLMLLSWRMLVEHGTVGRKGRCSVKFGFHERIAPP